MASMSKTELIGGSPAAVFAWTSDWANVREWMGPSVVDITMLSEHSMEDPLAAGVRFKETRKMGKTKASAIMEIVEHGPSVRGYRHTAVCDDGCNRWVFEYDFEPVESNAGEEDCRVTWRARSEPNKWWTKVLDKVTGPMMVRMMEKCEGDHLEKLKRCIEGDPTTA